MRIHLFGVAQDEAQASLDEHGHPAGCWYDGCELPAVAVAMFRRDPAAGWGSIDATAVCDEHEDNLLRIARRAPGARMPSD